MPATPTHTSKRAGLRIRPDVLTKTRDEHQIPTNAALADLAGVNESTLQRVIAGSVQPSSAFISGLLAALPRASFELLFERTNA